MARKDNAPSIATYADHEVITPPHELRKAVAQMADANDDPVARAEAALAQLSDEFADWMHAECERLEAARLEVKRAGFTAKTHDALTRRLREVTDEFLRAENADRPDYLESIFAPSLAPGATGGQAS
jgi:hypothetical protein